MLASKPHPVRLPALFFCLSSLVGCLAIDVELEFTENPEIISQIIDQTTDRYSEIELLKLSPEITALIDGYLRPRDSELERLEKLQDILYSDDYLAMRYSDARTHTAIEAFEAREGNCLSVMNLYVAMARYAGLRANFQTVAVQPNWDLRGNLLVLSQHINATGRFSIRRHYVVDFTPEIALQKLTSSVISDQQARALYFNNLGVEAMIDDDFEQALLYFKNALFLDSHESIIWNNIGATYNRMGNLEFAEYSYQKAFSNDNTNASAINNLVKFYRQTGNEKLVLQYERATERFNNRNPYYHFAQGNLAFNNKDLESAESSFRRAIRLKEMEPDFTIALSAVYQAMGDISRAAELYESAQELIAQNAEIYQPSSQKIRIIDRDSILRSSSPGISILAPGQRPLNTRR